MVKRLTMLSCSALFVSSVYAAPVYWAENDHYYELVESASDWNVAKMAAEGMALSGGYVGHLVTITSAAENLWISSTFGGALIDPFCWIGAYQTDPALATDEGWAWITGESWVFENWGDDEPNDHWQDWAEYPEYTGQYETVAHFWLDTNADGMTWADTLPSFSGMYSIVEYERLSPIPEPTTVLLFGAGLAGLVGIARRK